MSDVPTADRPDPGTDSAAPDAADAVALPDTEDVSVSPDTGPPPCVPTDYDGPTCAQGQCHFVVEADAQFVEVLGDFNGWADGAFLPAKPECPGVFEGWVTAPDDTVQEYKLKLDGAWALDPDNPYLRFGPFGFNSAIWPPGSGRLTAIDGVFDAALPDPRSLYVWLPAAYFEQPDADFPVLYMQDGFNVFTNPLAAFGSWDVEVAVQALGVSVIVVGVDTANRLDEYTYSAVGLGSSTSTPRLPDYAALLVGTIKPLIDATFRTRPDREHTAMAGSSLGGLSSLWTAWHHADTFGRVASLSGSFWIGQDGSGGPTMTEVLSASGPPAEPLRIYLDSGDSTHQGVVAYLADAWAYTDRVRNLLIGMGWDNRAVWDTDDQLSTPPADLPVDTPPNAVPTLEWSPAMDVGAQHDLLCLVGRGHAHNEAAWRDRMPEVLRFLFPDAL